jgi:hypothetical protein
MSDIQLDAFGEAYEGRETASSSCDISSSLSSIFAFAMAFLFLKWKFASGRNGAWACYSQHAHGTLRILDQQRKSLTAACHSSSVHNLISILA